MDCHSICDSPITQYSHRRTTSTISRCSTGTSYYGCVRYGNDTYGTVLDLVPVLPRSIYYLYYIYEYSYYLPRRLQLYCYYYRYVAT